MDLLDSYLGPEESIDRRAQWCPIMCLNGQMVGVDNSFLNVESSLLFCGVSFYEEIMCRGNVPYMWRGHYANISHGFGVLGIDTAEAFTANELKRRIEVLCQKNHYPPYSRLRIMFWLQGNELKLNYVILQERLSSYPYNVTEDKLFLTTYNSFIVTPSTISGLHVLSPHIYMARMFAKSQKCDEACFINKDGSVVSTSIGNIYLIFPGKLCCVSSAFGSWHDAITESLEYLASQEGYIVDNMPCFTRELMYEAIECFVASASYGIRRVLGYEDKRYIWNNGASLAAKFKLLHMF